MTDKAKNVAMGILLAVLVMVGVFLAAIIFFFLVLFFTFNDDSAVVVRQIVPSPDKAYQVEVVSYDEGALGGSTAVYVVEISSQSRLSEVGGKYISDGERVAGGNWNAYEKMSITWSDDLHFQITITYDFTDVYDVMDVDLSGAEIQTSGWYKETAVSSQ